jgi:uncharacterized repeat protein (TIGR03803 family)
MTRSLFHFFTAATLLLALSRVSPAQTVTTIHNFGSDAEVPSYVLLAQGRDGKLYGSTATTGMSGEYGTIFRLGTGGLFKILYTADITGYSPSGGVRLATDGNYYGVNQGGGALGFGELFKFSTAGVFTVLHAFSGGGDGAAPITTPLEASDGNIYGVTSGGDDDNGTVYKYDHAGNYSVLHVFGGSPDGSEAFGIMQAADGNLYITTIYGGTAGCGTIVKMSTAGSVLHTYSFTCQPSGNIPYGALIQASDGNFYGTTYAGGANNLGTLYKMTQKGGVSILHSFGTGTDASLPIGSLVQATDGNLYGTGYFGGVNNTGSLFQYTLSGGYSVLYSFPSTATYFVSSTLMQHTNGLMYGTTNLGGTYDAGTAFSLDMGLGLSSSSFWPAGERDRRRRSWVRA